MSDFNPEDYRVLIVDDDSGIRRMLSLALDDEGYVVETAESGSEALEKLAAEPASLIISDVRMPGGDGVYLLDEVRKHDTYTPIFILMSGFTDVTPEEALDRGANRFFHKPYKLEELLDAIEDFLTSQQ